MELVWHYSTWAYLPEMVKWGQVFAGNAGAENEMPMLWFSSNQKWEPTATKIRISPSGVNVQMTFAEQAKLFGCIRLGLDARDPRLLDWKKACSFAKTPKKKRESLEQVGRMQGANPMHWHAISESVPLTELKLQVWRDQWNDESDAPKAAREWEGRNV